MIPISTVDDAAVSTTLRASTSTRRHSVHPSTPRLRTQRMRLVTPSNTPPTPIHFHLNLHTQSLSITHLSPPATTLCTTQLPLHIDRFAMRKLPSITLCRYYKPHALDLPLPTLRLVHTSRAKHSATQRLGTDKSFRSDAEEGLVVLIGTCQRTKLMT